MIPIFISHRRASGQAIISSVATVLTIHNLLEQGKGSYEFFQSFGLPSHMYATHFEYYRGVNCFKAGLISADVVTTVSKTDAQEICESEDFGFGLAGSSALAP